MANAVLLPTVDLYRVGSSLPAVQSRVRVNPPSFGAAWVGVAALVTVAAIMIRMGHEHEESARVPHTH
jgi:hypothetical protein